MTTVAGIDEAGYGPVLGPLVVSAAVFDLPETADPSRMWTALSAAVSKTPSRRGGNLAIADSKKLYTRGKNGKGKSLARLERGVLAALAAGGGDVPASMPELLDLVAPGTTGRMAEYPWYQPPELALPRAIGQTDALLAGNALKQALSAAGMSMVSIRSEPVFVGQYNRYVAATKNKSTVLMDITGRLLDWLWREAPPGPLRIYVDRQGGRMRYLPFLQRLLPDCSFKVVDEVRQFSAYRIAGPGRQCEICFLAHGEQHRLPVALASMASKYLRELFMEMLNRYWTAMIPDLSPTAGYYTDGRRFYQMIRSDVRRLGIDERMLYRCR